MSIENMGLWIKVFEDLYVTTPRGMRIEGIRKWVQILDGKTRSI
jgi:hypothetical protein